MWFNTSFECRLTQARNFGKFVTVGNSRSVNKGHKVNKLSGMQYPAARR